MDNLSYALPLLSQTSLFAHIDLHDIAELLDCLCAKVATYKKGDVIIEEGASVYDFGIVLSGHGRAVKWDASDKLILISLLRPGSEFGVILAASLAHQSPVTVQAQDDVSALILPFARVLNRCPKACPRHDLLLRNYLNIVAEKGLLLHERIHCLLRPTVREKILTYLSGISREQQSRLVAIPMNRNAMAEYLNVERSALSRELSLMKKDGLIDYHKNSFRLF